MNDSFANYFSASRFKTVTSDKYIIAWEELKQWNGKEVGYAKNTHEFGSIGPGL